MKGLERRCLLEHLRPRYHRSSKKRKGEIITEVVERLSVCRKRAIRLLSKREVGRPAKPGVRGRPNRYGDSEFRSALKLVWKEAGYMCGRHLKEAIPEWLPFIERAHRSFEADVRRRLLRISAASIDRILKPYKELKGKSLTRSGSLLREQIPIQGNIWNVEIPGFMEADSVAHCGSSTLGEYIWSIVLTDIATTWTEPRATWGKGSAGVLDAVKDIERSLPFTLKGFDCDNGSEFLNQHFKRYFLDERPKGTFQFTRSRAYKKNDQAHVEQKNCSIARRYLGYDRLDCEGLLPLVQYYYCHIISPLINHFVPSLKLKDKVLQKSRFKRIYDKPKTPYARVMASPHVSQEKKEQLQAIHAKLDPVELVRQERKVRKEIDQLLRKLRSNKPCLHPIHIPLD